jgi:long-chain acyl-CoA synthetase
MALTLTPPPPALVWPDDCDTPAKVFRQRARIWAGQPALRHKTRGIWQSVDWAGYYANARAIGLALAATGVKAGEVVTVLSENRPEWLYADMGAQAMGMVGNGIYPTSSPEQAEYILADSRTRVLFVENDEQLDKVLPLRSRLPLLLRIVVMDMTGLRGLAEALVVSFEAFLAEGHRLAATQGGDFEAAIDAGRPDDLAFLVYTSGTTGAPKGAMLANRNVMFQMRIAPTMLSPRPGFKTLSFLPLCHVAERMATAFNQLALGPVVHFPENVGTVFTDLREVAPNRLFGPPRFWEKLHSQVDLFMQDAVLPAQIAYRKALEAGRAIALARRAGNAVSGLQRYRFGVMQHLVLANVRRFIGLSNVVDAVVGAAPVSEELVTWYLSLGIELQEAFGMTETAGYATGTPRGRSRVGRAGLAVPGVEVAIGAESEILVRGPNVFAGYWQKPDRTAEAIDRDGWLHTGDCGEIDADGYLKVTDRLKDILITAGGKNVTPSAIENLLKFSSYISDAMVVGDGRRYLTCLVMLDQDSVAKYAQDRQVPFTDFASMTRAPEVVALIRAEIEAVNAKLARVEQIKDFRIIDQLLTAEDEELTPTMKLKRRVVARKYQALIDAMYADGVAKALS